MKTKLFFIAVTIVMLTFMGISQPNHQRFGKGLCERLNLTDIQIEKVEQLRNAHQKQMVDMKADLEKLRIEMRELRQGDKFDRKSYIALEEKMIQQQNKMRLSGANHRMDIYELLDDTQKKEWKKMGNNIEKRKMNKRDPRNGYGCGPHFIHKYQMRNF
jgi:Spy/CpxP family protein refolding chaperone